LNPSKARQILDRVDLLSKIREEILSHPHLEERLCLCQPSGDTPDWWQPGRHDKELLLGAAKHGLGRTDITILNDPDFSFHKMLGKSICRDNQVMKILDKSEKAIKIENREDILKFDKDEILVKLEKGEGTLKIEKVGIKKDTVLIGDKKPETGKSQVELTIVKSENKIEETQITAGGLTITTVTKALSPEKEVESMKKEVEDELTIIGIEKEKPVEEKVEVKNADKNQPDLPVENKNSNTQEEEEADEEEEEVEEQAKKTDKQEGEVKDKEDLEEGKTSEVKIDESSEPKENEKLNEEEKDLTTAVKNQDPVEEENHEKKENAENVDNEIVKDDKEQESKEESKSETSKVDEQQLEEVDGKATNECSKADPVKEEKIEEEKEKTIKISKEKLPLPKIEDKCSMQAAELKAMFPDLEVIQPLSRLTQIDTFVLRDKGIDYNEPTVAQLLSHNYQSVKWPKVYVFFIMYF
jgi:chromodomain-helicase-DNA-binding protein 7